MTDQQTQSVNKQALIDLLEKVEAGTDEAGMFCPMWHEVGLCIEAEGAFAGSLDAAKALHEAVLPGWTVRFCAFTPHGKSAPHVHAFRMRQTGDDPSMGGNSTGYIGDCPARAWLIAILKALIAKETEENA